MNPRRYYLVATSAWFMAFGMHSVVFAWLVTIVLNQPAELVGWAQTALLAPGMLLIVLAGALADRVGADRQALVAQGFAAFIPWLLIVALNLGLLSFPVMVIYALLMGLAQAFVTPARDGLLSHVAGSRVQRTVLLTSLCQFAFQIVGYTVAGSAEAVGAQTVLIVQSVVLAIGVGAFVMIRRSGLVQPDEVQRSVLHAVVEGAKTINRSPVMRVVVFQNVAMALFFMGSFIVSFPLVIRDVFAGSSGDLAVLNAFNSLGLVATIIIMLRLTHVRRTGRALLLSQGVGAVVLVICGLVDVFGWFVFAVFCWGLCGGMTMPMSRTLMQELAPPAQRSRVMSFYALSFMGAGPLGTLLCGYLAQLFGPQMAIVICGALMLLVVLVMALTTQLWQSESDVIEVPSAVP